MVVTMKKPKLVITGCGHSGTRYLEAILRKAGIKASHEKVYGPHGYAPHKFEEVEVSWLAAGYDLRGHEVWHVVRDPIRVANSFLHYNFFRAQTLGGHAQFVTNRLKLSHDYPELDYWLGWNKLCESHKPSRRIQIEDLDPILFVENVAAHFGMSLDPGRLGNVMETGHVGKSNAKQVYDPDNYPLLPELQELAESYGYKV